MKWNNWPVLVMLAAAAAGATGVKIAGTLTTQSGKPLVGATVSLIKAKLSGTTDEDGMFGLYGNVSNAACANATAARAANPVVIGNAILFTVVKPASKVKLDAFNVKGGRIYSTELRNPTPGVCRLEIKPHGNARGNGLILIRLAIDDKITVLPANTLVMKPGSLPADARVSAQDKAQALAKDMTAAIDTMKITAAGYKTAMLPIGTYQLSTLTLSLDTGLTVIIDTSKSASKQDFLALAQRYKNLYYGQCYGEEKMSVDSALFTLKADEPFLSAAAGRLSTSAIALMGKGLALHASVVFAAAAALTTPDSADVVNNFGAVVRMLNLDSDAVTILLYANKLYPGAPLILTNLANTLLELGDDAKAEAYYRQALKVNSQYGPAHQGLGTLYFKQMNFLAAIDEFFAAAEFAFYGTTTKAISSAQLICGGMPDVPFGQETGDATGTGGPSGPDQSSLAPDDQLYIAPYPKWNGIDQFLAGYDDLVRWNNEVSGGVSGCVNWAFGMQDKVNAMDSAGKVKFTNEFLFYAREINGEQYLAAYFSDRINESTSQDAAAIAALDKALNTSLDQAAAKNKSDLAALEAWKPTPEEINAWIERSNEIQIDYNKKIVVAYDDYFGKWVVVQRKSYTATKQKLEEFWLYTEPMMKQLYCGGLVYQMVDNSRRSFVYTQLYKYTGALPMLAIGFSYYTTAKALSQATPDLTPPDKIESNKVPEGGGADGSNCPFKKTPLIVGCVLASMTVDCESAEIEGGEGIIGAVKYNFKKKETTLMLSAGFEARLGIGTVGASAAAKAGAYVTFDQNGNVTDGGVKADITAGGHLGPVEQAAGVELKGSAVTGVDVEYINRK